MKRKQTNQLKHVALAIFMMIGYGVSGQSNTYSLDACITMSLERNAQTKNSQLDVLASEFRIKEVKSALMPNTEITGQYLYYMQPPSQYAPASTFGGPEGQYTTLSLYMPQTVTGSMQLTQTLFNQSVFTGIRAAEASREVSKFQGALTEENIIFNVSATYYSIQVLNDNISRLEDNISNLEKSVAISESLKANELVSDNVHNRLLINLENLRNQYENQKLVLMQNHSLLKHLMNVDIKDTIQVVPFDYVEVLSQPEISDASQRPDILLQEAQVQLSVYDKKSTVAKYYPVLAGTLSMGFSSYYDEFSPAHQINNDWISSRYFGLTMKIPVFDGFQKQNQIRQKKVAIEKNTNTLSLMKSNAQKEINDATNDFNGNKNLVASNKKNLDLAEKLFQSVQSEYSNGLTSLTELINAQNDLTNARTNYSTALLNLKLAELSLKKANGSLTKNTINN